MSQIIYNGGAPKAEISDVFSSTMEELFHLDSKVVYIDADLMGSMKTKALWKKYPDNVVNTGIQEANMIGVAAGCSTRSAGAASASSANGLAWPTLLLNITGA